MLKIGSVCQINDIKSYERLTSCKVQVFETNKDGEEYLNKAEMYVGLTDKALELAADLNIGDFFRVKDLGVSRNKQYTNIYIPDAEKVEGKVVVDDSPEELPFS